MQSTNNTEMEAYQAIASVSDLDFVEELMLSEPQVDIPVSHHFGAGIYFRSGLVPAGVYVIGHAHKKPHMNMLTQGKLAISSDGDVRIIEAPYLFQSDGGRKLFYVLEDAVLVNIFATEETDVAVIEEQFVDKTDTWRDAQKRAENMRAIDFAIQNYPERNL